METNQWIPIILKATALITVAYLFTRTVNSSGPEESKKPKLTKETLLKFLRVLTDKWYTATRDIAELSRSVKQKLSQPGAAPITDEEFKGQLMHHCGVLEKLQELQDEVLKEFGLTAQEVEVAQHAYADDTTVKTFSVGFQTMLEDCLNGLTPIMPNCEIPAHLTEEKVLALLAEMQTTEIKKVCEHFEESGGFLPSVQALGNVLALANKDAETEIQKTHGVECNVFHSTMATYMRRGGAFVKKKEALDNLHRDRMVKMFKPASAKPTGNITTNGTPNAKTSNEDDGKKTTTTDADIAG